VNGDAHPGLTLGRGGSEREIDEGDFPLRRNRGGRWPAMLAALQGKGGRRKWLGRCGVQQGAARLFIGRERRWSGRARGARAAGGNGGLGKKSWRGDDGSGR
jgi:hypothetical protein